MKTNQVKTALFLSCATTALTMSLFMAGAAQAQSGESNDVEAVVVTGSRLEGQGFQAPTPVTVVTAEQLQKTAPGSLSDALNQLPEFRNSVVPSSTGPLSNGGGGGAYLNLRGLSAKRGLVLLDGKRLPSTNLISQTLAGATDISVLPQLLVRRVDVVTGGASAAYGSDALTGVVNFILDTKLQGFRAVAQAGTSNYGDNSSQRIAVAGGTAFADGRGHLIASAEYNNNDGVTYYGRRPWARSEYGSIRTLATLPQTSTSNPTTIIVPDVHVSNASIGGLITSGPLAGYQFTPGGGIAAFPFGTQRTATTMQGGGTDGNLGTTFTVTPESERKNAFVRVGYDLTPDWTIYAEGLYGKTSSSHPGLFSSPSTTQAFTIFSDNAYLTPAVKAALGNTASFTMGRIDADWGQHFEFVSQSIKRGVLGVDGKIGAFTLKASYEHAEAKHYVSSAGNANLVKLYDAIDAVVAPAGTAGVTAGSIVCRTTLTNPTNGCVPLNVFGPNAATPAALAYVLGTVTAQSKIKQDVADFSISGSPFELWAGPVLVGAGATYRKESGVVVADSVSESYLPAVPGTAAYKPGLTPVLSGNINRFPATLRGTRGGWESTNPGGLNGTLEVKEVFGEINVPLAKDLAFAHSLELNAAIRYADYSSSGGVTNWKIGTTYEPVDGVRFRITRSRDVRAANLADLYQGPVQSNGAVTDPFRNSETNTTAVTRTFGNPDVQPEIGNTFTGGVVLQPNFLPGFNLAVDYYNIRVTDTIGSLGGQVIVNQCFQGVAALCSLIQRTDGVVNGPIVAINSPILNAGVTKTEGIDFDLNYRRPLAGGTVTLHAVVNHLMKLQSRVTGATTTTESAGRVGALLPAGGGGGSKWSGTFSANFERGPFSLFVQERYIGGGVINNTVDADGNPIPANAAYNANATGNGLVPNHVGAVFYTDATATVKVPTRVGDTEWFLTVNNLFNKAPPYIPTLYFYGSIQTNYQVYDVIGRTFTAGVRLRF